MNFYALQPIPNVSSDQLPAMPPSEKMMDFERKLRTLNAGPEGYFVPRVRKAFLSQWLNNSIFSYNFLDLRDIYPLEAFQFIMLIFLLFSCDVTKIPKLVVTRLIQFLENKSNVEQKPYPSLKFHSLKLTQGSVQQKLTQSAVAAHRRHFFGRQICYL